MGTDVVVIGSGPNGLAAAVTLARAGLEVTVLEAEPTIGGGARTGKYVYGDLDFPIDQCSAVHPLAVASPFFVEFDLAARGVEFAYPEISYAHPLDGNAAGLAFRSLEKTAEALHSDGPAWLRTLGPLVKDIDALVGIALGDRTRLPGALRRNPTLAARFAARMLEGVTPMRGLRFSGAIAPAMIAGVGAHAITPPNTPGATAIALLLASLAHSHGWPLPIGGSQAITDALERDLLVHDGSVHTDSLISTWMDLPKARAYLFDTSAWTLANIMASHATTSRQHAWLRAANRFPVGNAASRVDFIISGPIPWTAEGVGQAGTVHLAGTAQEIQAAEWVVKKGNHAQQPVVLLSDSSTVDPSRSRGDLRAIWTYAHVPRGSTEDVTVAVAKQIGRFAPGFRDLILASRCISAAEMANHNRNYRDGDIAAGAVNIPGLLARPVLSAVPYRTPWKGVYICSASTPPGPGVHGMAGWNAARHVLRDVFGIADKPSLAYQFLPRQR